MFVKLDLLRNGIDRLGLHLEKEQLLLFETYCQELIIWNNKFNLTSIESEEEIQTRHFLDSLNLSKFIPDDFDSDCSIIDIGSGGGFPGLPLKILLPDIKLTLVESIGKKANFLKHVVDVLCLGDVQVCQERAETLAHNSSMREMFDLVVSRAVADLSVLSEITLPFCRIGGKVMALKGLDLSSELERSTRSIMLMGGSLQDVVVVDLNQINTARSVVILDKKTVSPNNYPRKAGIPAKRPITNLNEL